MERKKKTKNCKECKYARYIYATGGWSFVGCIYHPYKGKWVREIKDCPRKEQDE